MPLPLIIGAVVAAADIGVYALTGYDLVQQVTGYDLLGSASYVIDDLCGTDIASTLASTEGTYFFNDQSIWKNLTGTDLEQANAYVGNPDFVFSGDGGSGDNQSIFDAMQQFYDSIIENMTSGFTGLADLVNSWGTIIEGLVITGCVIGAVGIIATLRNRRLIKKGFKMNNRRKTR